MVFVRISSAGSGRQRRVSHLSAKGRRAEKVFELGFCFRLQLECAVIRLNGTNAHIGHHPAHALAAAVLGAGEY